MSLNATPTGESPVVRPLPERLADDLRTLADLVVAQPAVAGPIAAALAPLTVVSQGGDQPYLIGEALIERGAYRLPSPTRDPWWDTDEYRLPAGGMRLAMARLSVDLEQNAPAS